MNSDSVNNLEKLPPLADKYGLTYILSLVLLCILIYFLRKTARGDLVLHEVLDPAEGERPTAGDSG